MLILSLRDLLQDQSLEIIQACTVVCFRHNNIDGIHLCDECTRSNASSVCLSQDFVHLVTARASLFTDHKISGLSIRAKYRHFTTICAKTVDNSPTDSFFFFFKLMVIHAWRCDYVLLLSRFICKFAISVHTFLCVTFHVKRPGRHCFCIKFP